MKEKFKNLPLRIGVGIVVLNNEDKVLDASKPITLDFLTNPNKE